MAVVDDVEDDTSVDGAAGMRTAARLLAWTLLPAFVVATVAGCTSERMPAAGVAPPPGAALAAEPTAGMLGGAATIPALPPQPEPPPEEAPPVPTATPAPFLPPGPPPPHRTRQTAPPAIGARAAVVIDGRSGAVLFEHEAHIPLPPASTTKIMTALLAVELGNLDDVVEVQLDGRSYWGSVMGLVSGDRFTLRDLLYGLMLPSGNDAAYAIAMHISGSEAVFAEQMTARARQLGLSETLFRNASGLGRDTANAVSAHDLAQIARFAMQHPEFARIVGTRYHTARGSRVIGMSNGNGLLYTMPGADGVKIGWGGRFGGQTIVGSAVRGEQRLFVALLDTPDRTAESMALLNWAFATHTWEEP